MKKICLFLSLIIFSTEGFAQQYYGKEKDIQQILQNIDLFSEYFRNGEAEKMANCYTNLGKIFPNRQDIISGQGDIEKFWMQPEGVKITKHKITPIEIRIVKKTAYDYGYYEGETLTAEGEKIPWKGKYVIVWKKIGKEWKIDLDIWNGIDG